MSKVRGVKKVRACPTEDQEQAALFEWAARAVGQLPELAYMFHVPNGGYRSKATAVMMKRAGVKPGVADVLLLVPRGRYHGLIIECKALDGRVSTAQQAFIEFEALHGYKAIVCYGFEQMQAAVTNYLEGIEDEREGH